MFIEKVKSKYEIRENESCILVIIDGVRLKKYSTLLCDGTFSIFIGNEQLYLIYCQISPSLILLVGFCITSNRKSETYKFIYSEILKYRNFAKFGVIHDKEWAVYKALRSLNLTLIVDTFHLLVNTKDKILKSLLYKYIKNPFTFNMNKIGTKYQKYFKKEVTSFGVYGSHSTSSVESLNKVIKDLCLHRKSCYDNLLYALEDIQIKLIKYKK